MKKLIMLLADALSSIFLITFWKIYNSNTIIDAKIYKYAHYTYNYFRTFIYRSDEIWRTVLFKDNCRYDLGNSNQGDTNKLFRFGKLGIVNFKSAHM